MKVHMMLYFKHGHEREGVSVDYELSAVPREGETVVAKGKQFNVTRVVWHPEQDAVEVQAWDLEIGR